MAAASIGYSSRFLSAAGSFTRSEIERLARLGQSIKNLRGNSNRAMPVEPVLLQLSIQRPDTDTEHLCNLTPIAAMMPKQFGNMAAFEIGERRDRC